MVIYPYTVSFSLDALVITLNTLVTFPDTASFNINTMVIVFHTMVIDQTSVSSFLCSVLLLSFAPVLNKEAPDRVQLQPECYCYRSDIPASPALPLSVFCLMP